jgi:hypothetical protein
MTVDIDLSSVEGKMAFSSEVDDIADELKKRMAPEGTLGLPPLLEARRLKYAMPNGIFKTRAVYDRIYLWQIPDDEGETYGDTCIIMPEKAKERKRHEAPRGIIVSAGLKAMDNLQSNGMGLGHIVRFVRQAPWRMPIENIKGRDFYVMILRDGDITGSEDLQAALATGECEIKVREYKDDKGILQRCHLFLDKEGNLWEPEMPWMSDDY